MEMFGAPQSTVLPLFMIGMIVASLYFNDKYGEAIESANTQVQ
jgi:hypothetical protein